MSSSRYAGRPPRDPENALRDVQQSADGNLHCADCSHPRPDFINYTIGTFVCEKCADVHRSTSNRRIKDMYGGDISVEDVRRMESVGNDVANRKFLANWDSNEFPEPDRNDRDALLQFIWLKYEGTFKRPEQKRPNPPATRQHSNMTRDYGRDSDDRYNDSERNRPHRRESELFQDSSGPPDRPRSYWGTRFAPPPPSRPTGPPPQPRQDDYYRPQGPAQHTDRYHGSIPTNRFHPSPVPVVSYSHGRGGPHRYNGNYDEFSTPSGYDRDIRRVSTHGGGRYGREDVYVTDYGDVDEKFDAPPRRKTKSDSRVRRKDSSTDEDSYSSSDKNSNRRSLSSRKDKKVFNKKSKKPVKGTKSRKQDEKGKERRRRGDDDDDEYDDVDESDDNDSGDSDNDDEEPVGKRKKSKRKTSSAHDKRSDRDADSIRTASADGIDDVSNKAQPRGGKKDFDLMSEWMGDSKDTDTSQGVGLPPGMPPSDGTSNTAMPLPFQPQQAYQTQIPMMHPMGMYNSVMPGFMPMMHPGMPPPFMQGLGPLPAPSNIHPGMVPMPGMQPPSMIPGMQGLVGGMQNLGLNAIPPQGAPRDSTNPAAEAPTVPGMSTALPPPPPPMGMPAGPPPGPPPEPPQ